MKTDGSFLYPNVSSIPSRVDQEAIRKKPGIVDASPDEFKEAFDKALGQSSGAANELKNGIDLNQVRQPLKFSAHAMQRLKDRNITLDPATLSRMSDAVDKAASKGVQDTLVLTDQAALIVSVKNRTIVTALDRNSLGGNVFTNIDGAVIV